jgi:2-dehydro-3-deoxyphosphogluconate aldolase/(4S)-4-hydroxy-2-oxoglutarate aldolase
MFAALSKFKVVPLVKVKALEADDALKVAEALIKAGLPAMELMFRRNSDSKAIRAIATEYPRFWIGAGGILNKNQLVRAMDAKARFGISPGVNVETIREASRRNIMFAPGACTPSDIENILLNGSVDFQFFPAEQSGGIERLKAIIEPFEHLPLDIFAKGGIKQQQIKDYLSIPQVAAVSVDWIVTEELIGERRWDKITELAKVALDAAS